MSDAMNQATVVTQITPARKLTLAEVRARLEGQRGKRFWKNLEELADTAEFQELMREEFPRQSGAGEWVDTVSRRSFLKVMGASLALVGLAGCTKQPDEAIFPYVRQPEDLVLGKPMYFATAHPFPTGAVPVLVKSDAFRPIKVDGNPEHPMAKGRSDAFTQASLLNLYDPDRSREVRYRGESSSWGAFQQALAQGLADSGDGEGVYLLTESFTSPSMAAQWKQLEAKYPKLKLAVYDAALGDARYALEAQYRLEEAEVVLSLDADYLGGLAFPGFLPLSAAWAEKRRYEEGRRMIRTYAVETMPSSTGFSSDHRLALKPSSIDAFAQALVSGASLGDAGAQKFLSAVRADLKKAGAHAVVIAGPQSSAVCVAAAKAMNEQLGAVGSTVVYGASCSEVPETAVSLKMLVSEAQAGKVKWLVAMGVNPLYDAPRELEFAAAFAKVPYTAHLGMQLDETGYNSVWHIPQAHYLESWTDARAYDGTISIVQPMIAPLYGGVTVHEVLQVGLDPSRSAYDVVSETAKSYLQGEYATAWKKALHDGWVEGSAGTQRGVVKSETAAARKRASELEIRFLPDASLYDGRYANNGWLQELPKPVTNLSWDNAALMSLTTMEKYGLEENMAVELEVDGRKLIAGALMVPGHAPEAVTVHLGFGRGTEAGRVGGGVGFNAYYLRTGSATGSALKLKKTSGSYDLCVTKVHNIEHRGKFAQQDLEHKQFDTDGTYSLAGHEANERGIIRYATYEEAEKDPGFAHHSLASGLTTVDKVGYNPLGENPEHSDSFFPDAWRYDRVQPIGQGYQLQYKWGMSIDLSSCVGCNACIVSCYAENNIPVVGREQVKIGRNMQWLRIDTYFEGDLHAPRAFMQPMTCQHCENAGCEQVCPVGATVHTPEGINTMVYNRCVGTRYCSNNCPYKVRRFNWMLYADFDTESLKFMRNPDVSVRSRGVMEKCTYCIQRIEAAKIEADKNNRALEDGEIETACQQACPTGGIVFGNLNDPNSRVSRLKKSERDYAVLADLNYRPRTTYTAGVINPNPELA